MKQRIRQSIAVILMNTAMSVPSYAQEQTIDQKLDYIIQELEALKEAVAALSSEAQPLTPAVEDMLGALFGTALDGITSGGEQSYEEEVVPNSEPEQTLPLAILSWSAEEPEGGLYAALTPVQITLEIQNVSNKDIAILDGFADFHDRLGNDIGTMRLPQDLNLGAEQTVTHTGIYDGDGWFGQSGLKRLLEINPDFVDVELDLKEVLYIDGSSVSYE